MKKIVALFLICITLLSLFACAPAVIDVPVLDPDATVLVSVEPNVDKTAAPAVQTPLPTADVSAALTASPTPTPLPTVSVTPTPTPKPEATQTAKPTQTPAQTAMPTESSGKKYVALTFDDGPSKRGTSKILDVLERYNAKATFFVVGKSSPPDEDSQSLKEFKYSMMKRAVSLGCEIGNHTMEHKHLPDLSASEIIEQVEGVNDIVRDATGKTPKLVRPPYGDKSQLVYDTVDYPLILWSIDTLDWKTRDADSTYDAVMDNVRDGDIVLMHDIHSPTADAVEMIVPALVKRGYILVTVSELFEIKGIELQAGKYYRNAY